MVSDAPQPWTIQGIMLGQCGLFKEIKSVNDLSETKALNGNAIHDAQLEKKESRVKKMREEERLVVFSKSMYFLNI